MAAPSDAPKATGPLATLTDSLQQGRELLAGVADVASLESRLAALSLAQMLSLAVAAALLACSAWGLLLAFALASAGIPWLWLLPAMAVLNGLLAWWAWRRVCALSDDLGFTATRKLLSTLPATLSTSGHSHEEPCHEESLHDELKP